MGNSLATPPILPCTFHDCFQNGKLDIYKYQTYLILKRRREEEELAIILQGCQTPLDDIHSQGTPAKKQKRSVK